MKESDCIPTVFDVAGVSRPILKYSRIELTTVLNNMTCDVATLYLGIVVQSRRGLS